MSPLFPLSTFHRLVDIAGSSRQVSVTVILSSCQRWSIAATDGRSNIHTPKRWSDRPASCHFSEIKCWTRTCYQSTITNSADNWPRSCSSGSRSFSLVTPISLGRDFVFEINRLTQKALWTLMSYFPARMCHVERRLLRYLLSAGDIAPWPLPQNRLVLMQ